MLLSFVGELKFTSDGKYLMDVVTEDNVVYINKFNRCTGTVETHDSIHVSLQSEYIYSLATFDYFIYLIYMD